MFFTKLPLNFSRSEPDKRFYLMTASMLQLITPVKTLIRPISYWGWVLLLYFFNAKATKAKICWGHFVINFFSLLPALILKHIIMRRIRDLGPRVTINFSVYFILFFVYADLFLFALMARTLKYYIKLITLLIFQNVNCLVTLCGSAVCALAVTAVVY